LKVRDFTCFRDPAEDLVRGTVCTCLIKWQGFFFWVGGGAWGEMGLAVGVMVSIRTSLDMKSPPRPSPDNGRIYSTVEPVYLNSPPPERTFRRCL